MAISRVPGYSLLANLDRQGTDLTLTSSGLPVAHWDVSNYRYGINTNNPLETLHVEGNILVANGNVYTSGNLSYDLGTPVNQWRNLYAGNIEADNVNLSGTISIGGNITITGNTNSGVIYADELYDSNNRVLTTNTNFTLSGDVTGSGTYTSINVTIANTGVSAGTYGGSNQVSQITVNDKGQVLSASNIAIALSQIGNILVDGTRLYTSTGNLELAANTIILTATNGYVNANSAVLTGLGAPTTNSDAVTLQYLTTALGNVAGSLLKDNSGIEVFDDGSNPAWITTTIDGAQVANVTATAYEFYTNVNIGNFTLSTETISNTGNILLDSQNGIVKFVGDDAILLPSGDDYARPANPSEGYFRYNSDRNNIEFFNGNVWIVPGAATITSDTITPDGVGNAFVLSTDGTTDGVIVSINGTLQRPYYSYEVTGNVIQFTEVPLTTDIVEVRHITVAASAVTKIAYGNTEVRALTTGVEITGNVIPTANITYSLGSETNQWKDLWVSGNTIYIGGQPVTVANGQLSLGGNIIGAAESYGNINVAAYLGSSDITVGGNITLGSNIPTRIIGDFNNVLPNYRTLFQASSTGSTSVGIISNGGPLAELMVYSNASTQGGAGAIQAFEDEVRIKTYNYGSVTEIPMKLYVANQPVITLGTDYTTTLSNNLNVTGTITSGTWNGSTIGVEYGGTGGTTSADALNNLLPSGEQSGYVLTTSGAGTYYWASAGGGGGATVGQSLTTLRQSNTATAGQTVFDLVNDLSYTPGTGQLRVYVNGVRQFPNAYTETSANTYTLSQGVNSGTEVFAEIDQFSSFNNYANLTYASNVGNISASGLTVQAAIENLENNKAPLASPVFTGTPSINGVSIGFKELPQLTTSNVTLALTDSGKHFYLSSAGTYWYQVPSNANVAFPVGTTIVIVNKTTGNITANTQVEVSMYLAGNVTASNRTITAYGMATLIKTATNEWFINGTGVV